MSEIKPAIIGFDLGANRLGQPIRLVQQRGSLALIQDQANQRDDMNRIELTPQIIRAMASALKMIEEGQ